jgi:hypothetical protein
MKQAPHESSVPPLEGVEAALWRAAQRARDIARQTGTPLVIYRNGRVEQVNPDDVPLPKYRKGITRRNGK